jgi:Ser-tRNA(Ala) deacylase AlaX
VVVQPWQQDAYAQRATCEVVACAALGGTYAVHTTPTLLYPEGGGQPADRGTIAGVQVLDVQKHEGRVVHTLAGPVATGTAEVVVDWRRRFDLMQQHTGQHLLTAVLQDRFGAATTSFHLSERAAAIELDVPPLSPSRIAEVVEAVNAEIRAARPIRQREVTPDALADLGVRSRGLPEGFEGLVRLVEIDELDLNTCGGTHVRHTAELQVLAVTGIAPCRGGSRLSFAVGGRVLTMLDEQLTRERSLSRLLCGGGPAHVELAQGLVDARKTAERELRHLQKELTEAWGVALAAEGTGTALFVRENADMKMLQGVAGAFARARPDRLALLVAPDPKGAGMFLLVGPTDRVAAVGPEVASRLGGRGGGARGRFQGRASALGQAAEVVAWLET